MSDQTSETGIFDDDSTVPDPQSPVAPQDNSAVEEISTPEDLGENAHRVVTALLAHQRDLVVELREVYDRLEQVREVEYAQLRDRFDGVEASFSATPEQLQQLTDQVQDLTDKLTQQESRHLTQVESIRDTYSAQLAERDERIVALVARLDEVESSVETAQTSASTAHEKLDELSAEIESGFFHRFTERVSPAAQQAKSRLDMVARRLRR